MHIMIKYMIAYKNFSSISLFISLLAEPQLGTGKKL